MKDSTKNTLIVGASVLVASLGLFFIGRAIIKKIQAKKDAERENLLQEDIEGGQSEEQQQTEEATSTYNPTGDVNLISGYILGANLFVYPDEVNGIIAKLTNTDLKKLADAWKKKYGRSLYYDLDDEYDQCGWYSNCYEASMNRLSSLGLR